MDTHNTRYIINIYERYSDLKKSNKTEFDNNNLWKIFEYYCCIKLSEEYNKIFYEYDDIDPTFKELNKMTRNDTGIDLCDLENTIVQCKLRKNNLTWKDCATFFGSQNIFNIELNKTVIRWEQLIIARNSECILSQNLLERKELFVDKSYIKQELISFCENLMLNPPIYPVINTDIKLRDYQIEAITIITENKKNVIINLPTGTGKNTIIINSFLAKKKYLILVPRIILMDQLKDEIIKHNPSLKSKLQLIGDANNEFKENKLITICVFNSVSIIENYANTFEKIYIDEAHHINKPYIYCYDDDEKEEEYIININDKKEEDEVINTNDNNINDYTDEEDDDGVINTDDNNINEYTDDEYTDDEYIEDEQDDIEDELKDVKTYTQIIKSFVQYNNNVYLSATIDKIDNFEYYSKDIRDMIELKYLCDYTIHIPIFSNDPDNKKICEHLLKNYKNIIIYCNSQKEGKQINELMNKLQLNSSDYIDCKTPKKKRNIIIDKYKKGQISFLVNVRILVEGFDAPVTSGVMFLHMPTSKTTLIQIIGRCLRLHPTKNIANIILPFSSNDDEKNIGAFLKVIAKNDSRIKKSFQNKTLGGYISIDVENDDVLSEDIEFRYNIVYSSLGVLQNGEGIFLTKLDELKRYIDIHNELPNRQNKYNKQLSWWISTQKKNYKNKIYIMKNEEIYNKWTDFINNPKYMKYFQSNKNIWNYTLKLVIEYIDHNGAKPNQRSDDINIHKLAIWLILQKRNYKNKNKIMKNEEIYNKWTNFINNPQYRMCVRSNKVRWYDTLKEVLDYIDRTNERPIQHNKSTTRLGAWISQQTMNYKNKTNIMKNKEIYNKWTEIINNLQYKNYFRSSEDAWNDTLKEIIDYINQNNERISSESTTNGRNHRIWIYNQTQKYKKKKDIMKNKDIYDKWTRFTHSQIYMKYIK